MNHVRRLILYHMIVLPTLSKVFCSAECGNRCCLNFYRSSHGDCLECPLGTYGINCSGKCVDGFYGRFCRSKCYCPTERCDVRYGCQMESMEKYREVSSEWTPLTYALVGSVITMSLIGLLIYLRSWFSKSPDCFPSSGRLSTEVTESQRDRYESHGSTSSVGADHVVSSPRDQPDLNTYTDLRFSRMYDSSHDCGGGPQPTAPSVDSIPTQGCKDQNDKEVKGIDDDDDDNDDDGDVDDDGDGVDDDDVDDNNEVDDDAACKRK